MSKPISKEYFAIKVIERFNGCKHFSLADIKGAIDYVKDGYNLSVDGVSDDELYAYVLDEVSHAFA